MRDIRCETPLLFKGDFKPTQQLIEKIFGARDR
jgi:hypothetical protein